MKKFETFAVNPFSSKYDRVKSSRIILSGNEKYRFTKVSDSNGHSGVLKIINIQTILERFLIDAAFAIFHYKKGS